MTDAIERVLPPAVPAPDWVGQGTAVEVGRAIAQVQAAMMLARQFPRDEVQAMQRIERACRVPELAERAFYSYPRGGETVTGPTIKLARALAGCWGNIDYDLVELRRDDERAQSEMLVYAWDLETNTRSGHTFIVPHGRDKAEYAGPKGNRVKVRDYVEPLTVLRDIYENNANQAGRRLREQIFAVLPPHVVERAKALCWQTNEQKDGEHPLPVRIANVLARFEKIGVSTPMVEAKLGLPYGRWTPQHLALLHVTYSSLTRGETKLSEEFPEAAPSAEGIMRDAAAGAEPAEAPSTQDASETDAPITTGQNRKLHAMLGQRGYGDRDAGLAWISATLKRDVITTKDLSQADAQALFEALENEGRKGSAPDVEG